MKKNLRIVFGLVFLLLAFTRCESEDEINAAKNGDSEIEIDHKSQITIKPHSYTKKDIESLSCDEVETTSLYVGEDIEAGVLRISNSNSELFVTYDLNHSSWTLKEAHLYVGTQEAIPYDQSKNPKIGHFPYHAIQNESNSEEYTFVIPLSDLDDCFVIAAHAVVRSNDGEESQTAFAFGKHEFSGSQWGWYLDYCLKDCDEDKVNDNNNDSYTNKSDYSIDNLNGEISSDRLVSYAFNERNRNDSFCFLSSGFEQWGWTNKVFYDQRFNYSSGYYHTFPLLASAYQCDISNSLEVGYVNLKVTGSNGKFAADMEFIITDTTYDIKEIDLYIGSTDYPLDKSGNASIAPIDYNYRISSIDAKNYSYTNIPWPVNTNFIARTTLSPQIKP